MPTEKQYSYEAYQINVLFDKGLIRIEGTESFREFLSTDLGSRSDWLAKNLLSDYTVLMGKNINITCNSLIVEIWGHLYASHLARAVKRLIKLQLVENIADFVINRSDHIDCGEADIDHNRTMWDLLSNFKDPIYAILPKGVK